MLLVNKHKHTNSFHLYSNLYSNSNRNSNRTLTTRFMAK